MATRTIAMKKIPKATEPEIKKANKKRPQAGNIMITMKAWNIILSKVWFFLPFPKIIYFRWRMAHVLLRSAKYTLTPSVRLAQYIQNSINLSKTTGWKTNVESATTSIIVYPYFHSTAHGMRSSRNLMKDAPVTVNLQS